MTFVTIQARYFIDAVTQNIYFFARYQADWNRFQFNRTKCIQASIHAVY